MNLIIANNPTIAFSISRTLNCTDRTPDGAYTNDTGSIVITWVDPGLIAPLPMQSYAEGSDFIKTLPFIPKSYKYGIRQTVVNGKLKVLHEDEKKAETLFAHIENADEVTFASNGGAEAQALFSIVCQAAKVGVKTTRMWLNAMNHHAVNNAYRHRHYGRHLTRIARCGTVHLGMDFLFDTNIEQAFAQAYGKNSFKLRRTDAAMLSGLAVNIKARKEFTEGIQQHTVNMTAEYEGNTFQLFPTGVWDDKTEAKKCYNALREEIGVALPATVIDVKDMTDRPKPLYTLATLQADAAEKLGFMPGITNEVAEALFQKGYITSPLTSTPALPERLRRQVERRFPTAKEYTFAPDGEVLYCHGIMTTERESMFLTEKESKLYTLIDERMETAFSLPRKYTEVAVEATAACGMSFFGSIEMPEGYRPDDDIIFVKPCGAGLLGFSEKKPLTVTVAEFIKEMYAILPTAFSNGAPLPVDGIHDMGLVVQRLIDNGFITQLFGDISLTEKGQLLLKHVESLELADHETVMSKIQEVDALSYNLYGTGQVMSGYEDWIYSQIRPLLVDSFLYANKQLDYTCPKCGESHLTAYPSVVSCGKCNFSIPRFFKGYELTANDIRQLLTFGYTSPIYGFVGRNGCKFSQALVLDRRFGVTFADKSASIY
ncbi:MAG: DNA topoisomerase [Muribaculaceae bacterium]|nr:DNA topoisomerase [Muribaculaceae bacterium]